MTVCATSLSRGSLLWVGNTIHSVPRGGREMLSRLHFEALKEICRARFHHFELSKGGLAASRTTAAWHGYIDGLGRRSLERLASEIRTLRITEVWLDGSNLGAAAAEIRRQFPDVLVTTFFHNCEARFFLGAWRRKPTLHALGVLAANYRAERMAVRNSHRLVCLNERDSLQVQRLYGRSADAILPMALRDQFRGAPVGLVAPTTERYALFVGGTFYANRQGIEWFVDNVAGCSALRTLVVGKGFEQWKQLLERHGNVQVIGEVENLASWYLGAQIVLAPIFDGSGMKTKVAEALMFGKRVIGTPEAFVGYEAVLGDIGTVCNSASEFIAALNDEAKSPSHRCDPRLRTIYEANYSYDAAKTRLAEIIGDKRTASQARP